MRRLLRLALPLGLLAALVIPTGAFAQATVSTNVGGGLALLASSPTALETSSFTGNLHSNTIIDGLSVDVRSLSVGSAITGTDIPAGTTIAGVGVNSSLLIAPAGTNNDLTWFANISGSAGDAITIEYFNPGTPSAVLSATVVGTVITINLGTSGASAINTTDQALRNAVHQGAGSFAAVKALVSVVETGDTTAANVTAMPATPLAGGADQAISLSQAATSSAAGVSLQASIARRNTDMAFWGNTLVQGDTRGIRIFDISNPALPALLSDFACNGAPGDVSIWGNLVFRSVDRPQTGNSCTSMDTAQGVAGGNHLAAPQTTTVAPGFEGIQIIDISNPSSPSFVGGVATDCGSFTHTLVPDLANNRVLLYVSSFPNVGIENDFAAYDGRIPTAFGNTCVRRLGMNPGDAPAGGQGSGHDKISIVAIPLGSPATASVINEVTLGLKGYNSYFSYLPDYTGDFNNTPGYKGCHDIAVHMPTNTAAAACVTEGVTLDITNPAAPTVQDHFTNSDIDLCATGVFRWVSLTQATTPNCMWGSATFTWDGSRIIWGSLQSGHGGCNSNSATVAHSCNQGGNTNVSVDRFYDGQSTSNECETGAGTAPVRSPINRAAFWMNDAGDSSWPISSFKIPFDGTDASVDRYERYSNQGCSASLGNVVPVNGAYVLPLSWHTGGVDVMDWTDPLNTFELGWFDVDTSFAEGTANANATNRLAGNSALKSNAWAAYWYNGYVYASNEAPAYGSWSPEGSRGLEVFQLNDPSVAGAFDLAHLNPQTQENSFTCTATAAGSLKVGKKTTVKVSVKVMGQPVVGANVRALTYGFKSTKTTGPLGQASFTLKPKKANTLKITIAGQPNMAGCDTAKSIAKAKKK